MDANTFVAVALLLTVSGFNSWYTVCQVVYCNFTIPLSYPAKTIHGDGSEVHVCPTQDRRDSTRDEIRNEIRMLIRDVIVPGALEDCEPPTGHPSIPCGGPGWQQIAYVNMSDPSHHCPSGLHEVDLEPRRCVRRSDSGSAGCGSTYFSVGAMAYTSVCGRIVGYQFNGPDAFGPYNEDPTISIDGSYVDGVSVTHGPPGSREHIWTFAAALSEISTGTSVCSCTNTQDSSSILVPPYVGNDYFCETGTAQPPFGALYVDDPLWDGLGCGDGSTCCGFNNPPFFTKQLGNSTTDSVEVRICLDQRTHYEDIAIELIELYVQ